MKGIVFTEFLEMVDDKFGLDVTESIVTQANLPSGGAYTSVGTYSHSEIVALVIELSKASGLEVPVLIKVFGEHLLGRFVVLFPDFFAGITDVTEFLSGVDGYIHVEVRKLYPDATLPKISTHWQDDEHFVVDYQSDRMMGDLAEGLIGGAIAHFGKPYDCVRTDLDNKGAAQCVKFTLKAQP